MERKQEKDAAGVVTLRASEATPESFAPFGQVVSAGADGAMFGPDDAQLDLSRGIPRFYIMRLENQPLKFSAITHHASVTQCWAPSAVTTGTSQWPSRRSWMGASSSEQNGREPVKSRAGHQFLPPDPAEVCAFRVSGPKFLKLHRGTWHAGPLFTADSMHFYNLELSDTNIVDHTTHHFTRHNGVSFVVED